MSTSNRVSSMRSSYAKFKILYQNGSKLLNNAKEMYEGVYYEVEVQSRESGETQIYTIDSQSIEDQVNVEKEEKKIELRNPEHPLQEQLTQIEKLKYNHEMLNKTAEANLAVIRQWYNEEDFIVTLNKRQEKLHSTDTSEAEELLDTEDDLETEDDLKTDSDEEKEIQQDIFPQLDFKSSNTDKDWPWSINKELTEKINLARIFSDSDYDSGSENESKRRRLNGIDD